MISWSLGFGTDGALKSGRATRSFDRNNTKLIRQAQGETRKWRLAKTYRAGSRTKARKSHAVSCKKLGEGGSLQLVLKRLCYKLDEYR